MAHSINEQIIVDGEGNPTAVILPIGKNLRTIRKLQYFLNQQNLKS